LILANKVKADAAKAAALQSALAPAPTPMPAAAPAQTVPNQPTQQPTAPSGRLTSPNAQKTAPSTPPKKSNTALYVGLGILILGIGGFAIFKIMKNKNAVAVK
jgi:hypothetical protein